MAGNLPLTSILLTKPIVDAAKQLNPNFKPVGFQGQPGEQGFPLPRIQQNMELLRNGTAAPPISVKQYGQTGKYVIVDGRHRFAIALSRGEQTIPAVLVSGGKRTRRKTSKRKARRTK